METLSFVPTSPPGSISALDRSPVSVRSCGGVRASLLCCPTFTASRSRLQSSGKCSASYLLRLSACITLRRAVAEPGITNSSLLSCCRTK
uniref:Uncharacterized protein n=1 Tax=Ciona intestinalis TaxID=7719 RepID=H2XT34_CIOIN